MTRLKGDETYPQCPKCLKPIRDDQDSVEVTIGGKPGTKLHEDCFMKRMAEITGGTAMAGEQTIMDPETGEPVDEATIQLLYTDTSISGKMLLTERCRLGEFVKLTVIAQVKHVGDTMDDKGHRGHVQKLAVTSIEDVKRGAI